MVSQILQGVGGKKKKPNFRAFIYIAPNTLFFGIFQKKHKFLGDKLFLKNPKD